MQCETDSAKIGVKLFELDFEGEDGECRRSMKNRPDNDYSEMMRGPGRELWPSGTRWIQLLDGAKAVTSGYNFDGKEALDIVRLAKNYDFTVEPFSSRSAKEIDLSPEQRKSLRKAAGCFKRVDAFSTQEKKIYYNSTIDKRQQFFVIAHELSHFLLGHKLPNKNWVFCKITNDRNPKETREYHEEADKLAAILLIPHFYLRNHRHDSDKMIADALGVPEKAVRKRRIEVDNEMYALCYGWTDKTA